MQTKQKLYRPEAIEGRRSTLFGAIRIAQPVPLVVMSALVVLIMAIVITFLVFGTYARKVTVQGYLMPESGVSRVYSPADGVASQLLITEGQCVDQGDILVEISTTGGMQDGSSATAEILEELQVQHDVLVQQMARIKSEHTAEISWLARRLELALLEESQVRSTMLLQSSRIRLADEHREALEKLKLGGFASENQLMQVNAERLLEEKQLAELALRMMRVGIERS
jgi:membrane fusion protein